MKKFNFKLAPLLNYRKYLERIAQQNTAKAHMEVLESKNRIENLNTERTENMLAMDARVAKGTNAVEFQRYYAYDQVVNLNIWEETARKEELDKILREKLLELKKKSIDKKAMETYRDRLRVKYDTEMVLEEQKLLDEIASLKTARKGSDETL